MGIVVVVGDVLLVVDAAGMSSTASRSVVNSWPASSAWAISFCSSGAVNNTAPKNSPTAATMATAPVTASLGPRLAPAKIPRHRTENRPRRIGVSTRRYDASVTIVVSSSANTNSRSVNLLPATPRIIW